MIGISSRALFDLEEENAIFESQGVEAYVDYQIAHEKEVLAPGAAFSLIQAFLALNRERDSRQIEVVIMSKNSADAALRIFHSIEYYGLDITRAALTGGGAIAPYLRAYGVDLYLSRGGQERPAIRDSRRCLTAQRSDGKWGACCFDKDFPGNLSASLYAGADQAALGNPHSL